MKAKAAFLDRDGVLNIDKYYLHEIKEWEWMPEAREAVAYLNQQGFLVFLVTNQSGIARGLYDISEMERLHAFMEGELAEVGAHIDKIYYCPHLQEGVVAEYAVDCVCRKPKPGMILQAFREYDLAQAECFLIGDRLLDLEAAKAAGIAGYQYAGGSLLTFVKDVVRTRGAD